MKNSLLYTISVLLLVNSLLSSTFCFAQNNNIGIGTLTPAPSALLDVNASSTNNKGILVPRMTTLQRLAIPSPANSLLVFDTDFACFFYYSTLSSSWKSLCNSGTVGTTGNIGFNGLTGSTGNIGNTGLTGFIGSTGTTGANGNTGSPGSIGTTGATGIDLGTHWIITGNSGSTAGTNFIGTTDANDLLVKTNNTEKARVTSIGNIGIGTATPDPSALLDLNSGSGNNQGLLIPRLTTSQRNAIASPALSLFIFNTTNNCFEAYVGGAWYSISCPTACNPPNAPTANTATDLNCTSFTANWSSSLGATSYYLDVSTDAGFTSFIPGYNNQNVGNLTSYNITGLTSGVTYYYRLRAATTCTSVNSTTISFTTPACNLTCGSQEWTPVNLDVGIMINSTGVGQLQTNNGIIEKYCYNNVLANCTIYGGFYEWGEAMDYAVSVNCDPCGNSGVQGLCPSGFHIPGDLEWSRFEYCIENTIAPAGSTSLATFQTTTTWRGSSTIGQGPGEKMKVTSSNSPAWDGTNTSGFAALPTGEREIFGTFIYLNTNAWFWSSTDDGGTAAWSRQFDSGNPQSYRFNYSKSYGFSVRCLKN